jgi:hypothetical protein
LWNERDGKSLTSVSCRESEEDQQQVCGGVICGTGSALVGRHEVHWEEREG